jgi:hypothetical protein
MDPATALLIGSGVSAAAGGASAIASGKMNRKSINRTSFNNFGISYSSIWVRS